MIYILIASVFHGRTDTLKLKRPPIRAANEAMSGEPIIIILSAMWLLGWF
jgi:hypothetical protein